MLNVGDAGCEIDTHVRAGLRAVAASWVDAAELKALCTWATRIDRSDLHMVMGPSHPDFYNHTLFPE